MFIVLPPSETKSSGGDGAPLDMASLSFPELNPIREDIAYDLQSLSIPGALEVLGLSEAKRADAAANQELFSSPTTPAIFRYTGVLYDALSPRTLPATALDHLAVGSALFGLVGARDPIPKYRLSGGTKLPRRNQDALQEAAPTMKKRWRKAITQALERVRQKGELVIDMRSGVYHNLGRLPGAATVRVENERPDGSRKVVSHFNKHHKGILARVLASYPDADHVSSLDEVVDLARGHGMRVEAAETRTGKGATPSPVLTVVVSDA